jgi:hypothetical protein
MPHSDFNHLNRRERALWCQRLARAMVDAELSVDAAAQEWGLTRGRVNHIIRSDTAKVPAQVRQWLSKNERRD